MVLPTFLTTLLWFSKHLTWSFFYLVPFNWYVKSTLLQTVYPICPFLYLGLFFFTSPTPNLFLFLLPLFFLPLFFFLSFNIGLMSVSVNHKDFLSFQVIDRYPYPTTLFHIHYWRPWLHTTSLSTVTTVL